MVEQFLAQIPEGKETTGMVALLGIFSLLAMAAAYRWAMQRRQLSSGRTLGRFLPRKQDGKFIFDNTISVTVAGKWCRLLLTLEAAATHQARHSPRYFFQKVAMIAGTPYTFSLRDGYNREIFSERGSLGRFVPWLKAGNRGINSILREQSITRYQGTVVLLEFLPQDPGLYSVSLQITDKAEAEYPGSSSSWEVLSAELCAAEDVIPLSRFVKYPHQQINIRKQD